MTPREYTLTRPRPADPVTAADYGTTLADLRIAACIAAGVPLRHIDPADGYDMSPQSYREFVDSWTAVLRSRRPGRERTWEMFHAALDEWITRRPDVVAAVEEVLAS